MVEMTPKAGGDVATAQEGAEDSGAHTSLPITPVTLVFKVKMMMLLLVDDWEEGRRVGMFMKVIEK
jgi:hypothetical protein